MLGHSWMLIGFGLLVTVLGLAGFGSPVERRIEGPEITGK